MCPNEIGDVTVSMLDRGTALAALHEVFEGMSPTAKYMRYLTATPRLTTAMTRILSDVDRSGHVAWRAICGEHTVGLVRLHEDEDGLPELAVEVVDDHTGRGIGKALVSTALNHAAAHGATAARVLVHPENTAAIRLFRSTGGRLLFGGGLLEGTIPVSVTVAA